MFMTSLSQCKIIFTNPDFLPFSPSRQAQHFLLYHLQHGQKIGITIYRLMSLSVLSSHCCYSVTPSPCLRHLVDCIQTLSVLSSHCCYSVTPPLLYDTWWIVARLYHFSSLILLMCTLYFLLLELILTYFEGVYLSEWLRLLTSV